MYEKTNSLCLTMQRYGKKLNAENPFNESPRIICESSNLYFVSTSKEEHQQHLHQDDTCKHAEWIDGCIADGWGVALYGVVGVG